MNNSTKMTAAQQRQEFCVRWNSHLGSIGAAFPQLLAGQRFVDVTLACEGHQVHCHRLVLAACSSYFESILAENPCKHPVIILPNEIKLWEIQALVDFMYKGEVNVTLAGLPNLLRCAEQLRIRGLYGSDAALNLNQLKALTNKVSMAAAASASTSANNTNDSTETDNDSGTTTTTATTTIANAAVGAMHGSEALADVKKQSQQQQNGSVAVVQQQMLLQQQQQQQQHLQLKQNHLQNSQLQLQQMHAMLKQETNASNATEDDSADESTSNAYDNEDDYSQLKQGHTTMETTMEEDSSYVGNDEDSYCGAETELDSSGVGGIGANGSGGGGGSNAYMMQKLADGGSAYKRIRRSEDSLAQAAKCVSKGQTFQTVSNMFNIPVSTIRFYMARKGILPKRKRGRGASTTASGAASLSSAVMSQALAQMKRSNSPTMEAPYNLVGYTLAEGATANMI